MSSDPPLFAAPSSNASMASSPTGPQLWRLLYLIQWLREGRSFTAKTAAKAFEVSDRTVYSDLHWLRHCGVPLAFEHRKNTYLLTEPFEGWPLVPLKHTEWAAFLVARHALEALGDTPHAILLEEAMNRLAEHLPETIHIEPDTLSRVIRFESGPRPAAPLPHLELFDQAIREQRVLHLHYFSNSKAETTERQVEPYQVLSYEGRGYLIGYCRLRQEMRDFRIDRIQALKIEAEVFARDRDFDLDAYLGPAFGMHRGDRTYAVCIRFSPYQARWIAEERWHESQLMVRREDGSLDVHLQVTGLADVARWVLSYGGEAEVVGPPILRHRVAREARKMAERYADDTTLSPTPDIFDHSLD